MKKGRLISFYSIHNFNFGVLVMGQGAETSCMCVCTKRVCVSNNEPKACTVGKQYIRISVFVQSRGYILFILNCLLKNKFNTHVVYYLYIYVNTISKIFISKNKVWLKFTINYSLFKLKHNWRHCSAISLIVMLCVCTKKSARVW